MSIKMNLGGTEKSLLSFLNLLDKNHNDVTLLLLEPGGDMFGQIPKWIKVDILDNHLEIKDIVAKPPYKLIIESFFNKLYKKCFRTILRYLLIKITNEWSLNYKEALKDYDRTYKADIAIAFAGPHDFISYFVLDKVQARKKIQWIRFDVNYVINNNKFGKKFYPNFEKIFCISENCKNNFINMFPQMKGKTEIFRNLISHSEKINQASYGQSYGDDYKGHRILTIGRLSQEKGQNLIPRVVCNLRDSKIDFRWYIIGEGKMREELEDLINELGIEDNLILLGAKNNPYSYLKDCDLYVHTSRHEGYGNTVHEAKIFKKPVVTTNFLSATNLIVHEKDGLIVDFSEDAIFEGIKRVLQENGLLQKFSKSFLIKDVTKKELEKLFKNS